MSIMAALARQPVGQPSSIKATKPANPRPPMRLLAGWLVIGCLVVRWTCLFALIVGWWLGLVGWMVGCLVVRWTGLSALIAAAGGWLAGLVGWLVDWLLG